MPPPPDRLDDQQQPQRSSAPPEDELPGLESLLGSPRLAPGQPTMPPPANHATSQTTEPTTPNSGPGTEQAGPGGSSWAGRVPSFFVLGPGGNFTPRFTDHDAPRLVSILPPIPPLPRPAATPPTASPAPGDGSQPSGQDTAPPAPPLLSDELSPFLQFIMPFTIGGLRDNRPDPEAAAELLRSLPTVTWEQFRRVERIVVAEQVQDGEEGEKGWKCAICLEGVEENAKETGIKVLPCNHLFHEACIEPWFTSNHTCPTCRLDLDPMKTLRRHGHGRRVERPAATGTGRDSPHPYSRSENTTPAPEQQRPQTEAPEMTLFWHIRPPTVPNSIDAQAPANAEQQPSGNGANLSPDQRGTGERSSDTPTFSFEFPLRASPTPMTAADPRRASASPSPAPPSGSPLPNASTPQPGEQRQQQEAAARPQPPLPQRRPHIFVHHHHHHLHQPGSPGHHHHLRPPVPWTTGGPSSPLPTSGTRTGDTEQNGTSTTPNASENGQQPSPPTVQDTAAPRESGSPQSSNGPTNDGPSSDPNAENSDRPADGTRAPGNIDRVPHFHIFFEFNTRPGPGPGPTGPPPPAEPQAEPEPIERPSLDSWVVGREKSLGWRCDAPECGVAPTDEDGDEAMPINKEDFISIFSPIQPPVSNPEHSDRKGFMIHACEHRWHRSCLETVERSAGHILRPDEDGRVWVRCERCRKSGWIPPLPRSPSEGEVERIVA